MIQSFTNRPVSLVLLGYPSKTSETGRFVNDWIKEVQERGAGEIVLNCMNQDGVRHGYDIEQLETMRLHTNIPLIASGGAGEMNHFEDVFHISDVSGALAAASAPLTSDIWKTSSK